jgi:integrase
MFTASVALPFQQSPVPTSACKIIHPQDILPPAQSIRQKAKRYMSKRFQAGTVYLHGKKWHGRYRRDVPGQEKREYPVVVLGSKKEMSRQQAKQKLMEVIQAEGINERTYLEALDAPVITFGHVADAWMLQRLPQLKISTQKTAPGQIAKHLRPFFGAMPVESIKTGTVNQWIGTLRLAPKTVRNLWKQFTTIMNWDSRQNDEPNRTWRPSLPTIPDVEQRWFTEDEMRQIIDAAHAQYKVFFRLAGATGLRFGELAGLHVEDLDLVDGMLYVRRSVWRGIEVSTKTKRGYRPVPFDSGTVAILKAFLGDRTTGRVFQGERGAPLDNHTVTGEVLKPICKRLGIAPGGCHAFRHGRVSQLQANNVPGDLIKNHIGHSSLNTTRNYTHFSETFVRDTVERLSLTCTPVHTN